MLTYLSIAGPLFALRKKSFFSFFLTGVIYAFTFLNRAEHFITPVLFISLFPVIEFLNKKIRNLMDLKRALMIIFAMSLGVTLTWAPWLDRSNSLYGKVCFFTTSAAPSFFWEYGGLEKQISPHLGRNSGSYRRYFYNDYEQSEYANELCRAWLKDNKILFYKKYLKRVKRSICSHKITATKVPRDKLFLSVLDGFLIDKSAFLVVGGMVGMLVLTFLFSDYLYIIPIITLAPWMCSLLFGGVA